MGGTGPQPGHASKFFDLLGPERSALITHMSV
jgi:hypothetical protein